MAAGLTAHASALVVAWRREWRFVRTSRWDLAYLTVFPLAMLALMAWLFSASVMRELPVAVVDQDASPQSRLLLRMIEASPGVRIESQWPALDQARAQVRARRVYAVVQIPADFSRRALAGTPATVFVFYNATYMSAGQSADRDIAEAVSAYNARLLVERIGRQVGPAKLRAAPIAVQSAVLFNPSRSYELFLLPLIMPALLSLLSALAMAGAIGRELRDGTLRQWLADTPSAAMAGKLLPYVLLFSGYGVVALAYGAWVRGDGVAGSTGLLVLGQMLLHLCSAGIALMFVGVPRDMGTGLSGVGLVVGASLAFSAATFPVIDAPLFTRAWSAMLPLTAYLKLQMQQWFVGAPVSVSLAPLGGLVLIAGLTAGIGRVALLRPSHSRGAQTSGSAA